MTRALPSTLALFLMGTAALFLASCARPLGPDYETPETVTPAAYKNTNGIAQTGAFPSGEWWKLFGDADLTRLVGAVESQNRDAAAAWARYQQAMTYIGVARADLLPNFDGSTRVTVDRSSDNTNFRIRETSEAYSAGLILGWEIDLWGRVRRLVESAKGEAAAANQNYESLLLSLQAQTARIYFTIRALDAEILVVDATSETRQTALDLQNKLAEAGNASDLEVARAESELATTQAIAQSLRRGRGQFENALGVLVGSNPSEFALPARSWNPTPPRVPAGIPGELLVRRPDVAAAESLLVAANARIGSAKAEFLPRLTLTADGGLSANNSQDFLEWSSRVWSFSPGVDLPIFQGGRLLANLDRTRAEYDETLANYQQQVLVAFRDVEDALNDLQTLQRETAAQNRAVTSAQRVEELSNRRYTDGLVNYFEVVDSQRVTLESERRQVQLRGEYHNALVSLIQALGGGWTAPEKPGKPPKEEETVEMESAAADQAPPAS